MWALRFTACYPHVLPCRHSCPQVSNPRYRRHTLDGDGMVFSLAFKEGQAFFRNRFVRTEGFKAEQVGVGRWVGGKRRSLGAARGGRGGPLGGRGPAFD